MSLSASSCAMRSVPPKYSSSEVRADPRPTSAAVVEEEPDKKGWENRKPSVPLPREE